MLHIGLVSADVKNVNSQIIAISGKAKAENIPYLEIDGKQIKRVSEFKILCLQLSNNLN